MRFLQRALHGSVLRLTRAACAFALLGLALMSYSILDPRAIPVITAMSVGHGFGFAAFGCYLLAVVLDARTKSAATPEEAVASGHSDSPPVIDTRHDHSQ